MTREINTLRDAVLALRNGKVDKATYHYPESDRQALWALELAITGRGRAHAGLTEKARGLNLTSGCRQEILDKIREIMGG